MPSTIIDSAIFGDIFSTPAMRRVWSDENRTAKYPVSYTHLTLPTSDLV